MLLEIIGQRLSDSLLYSFYAQDRTEIWLGKDGYVNVPFIAGQAAEFAVYLFL